MSDNADTPSMKNLTETVNVRYDNIARVSLKCRKTILLQKIVIIILLLYFRREICSSYSIRVYTKLIKL